MRIKPIILYGALAILFSACFTMKPVQVTKIENFKSYNVLSDPEIRFDLEIKNPNNFGVSLVRMDMKLYSGETVLVGINLLEKTRIGRNRSASLPVSMKPSMEAIKTLLQSEMSNLVRGKVDQKMELRGDLVTKKFLFKKKVKIKEPVRL